MRSWEAAGVWAIAASTVSGSGLARAEDCPAPAAALAAALAEADLAFQEMDLDAFRAASGRAGLLLGCLSEPLTPALAAAVHRNRGLDAFLARDLTRAPQAFAAARALDPEFAWSEQMLPPRHPVRELYAAQGSAKAVTTVAEPGLGGLRFDGRATLERPEEVPTILQRLDDAGQVAETLYLWPGESPGWLQPAPRAGGRLGVVRSEERAKRGAMVTLGATALAAGVSALALYDAARREAEVYWDQSTPVDELDGIRARVNTRQGLALGAAALGVSAGAGVVLVMTWE